MRNQTRLTDITFGIGTHGHVCCSHIIIGYRITGSINTFVNNLQASRVTDLSIHDCPHCGFNMCIGGSPDTFINNLKAHRYGDIVTEFCGLGITVTGSPNVYTNI